MMDVQTFGRTFETGDAFIAFGLGLMCLGVAALWLAYFAQNGSARWRP